MFRLLLLLLQSLDLAGNVDSTPAIFKWTILTPVQGINQILSLSQSMNLNQPVQSAINGLLHYLFISIYLLEGLSFSRKDGQSAHTCTLDPKLRIVVMGLHCKSGKKPVDIPPYPNTAPE